MASKFEIFGMAAAAVAVGALYVVAHEARRKQKKAAKAAAEAPISKEMLLKILNKSAQAAQTVIEQLRSKVRALQKQQGMSDEQAMQVFQQNFERSLDQLIGAIRKEYQVTEKAMDASFKLNQSDPEVQQAIQNMRSLSAGASGAGTGGAGTGTASSSSGSRGSGGGIPDSLTKTRLREIMTFNAVMLEKELKPIKEQVEILRQQGQQGQVDPQVLIQVQQRISDAVHAKFGVTDEQVMAAVDAFGAKNDPSFKEILQRIATTLSSSFGG